MGALLIDDASSSAGECMDDSAEEGRETTELAVEFRVEVALDFLVEPSDHLPNALLNLFAGRSPLPRSVGGVVGLSKLGGSAIIDTTTVDASL